MQNSGARRSKRNEGGPDFARRPESPRVSKIAKAQASKIIDRLREKVAWESPMRPIKFRDMRNERRKAKKFAETASRRADPHEVWAFNQSGSL